MKDKFFYVAMCVVTTMILAAIMLAISTQRNLLHDTVGLVTETGELAIKHGEILKKIDGKMHDLKDDLYTLSTAVADLRIQVAELTNKVQRLEAAPQPKQYYWGDQVPSQPWQPPTWSFPTNWFLGTNTIIVTNWDGYPGWWTTNNLILLNCCSLSGSSTLPDEAVFFLNDYKAISARQRRFWE